MCSPQHYIASLQNMKEKLMGTHVNIKLRCRVGQTLTVERVDLARTWTAKFGTEIQNKFIVECSLLKTHLLDRTSEGSCRISGTPGLSTAVVAVPAKGSRFSFSPVSSSGPPVAAASSGFSGSRCSVREPAYRQARSRVSAVC